MLDSHLDAVLEGRGEAHGYHRAAESHAAVCDPLVCCVYGYRVFVRLDLVHLRSVVNIVARLVEPESV